MKRIHTFESFLSAGEPLRESKIDASRLKSTGAISIHGNPDAALAKYSNGQTEEMKRAIPIFQKWMEDNRKS